MIASNDERSHAGSLTPDWNRGALPVLAYATGWSFRRGGEESSRMSQKRRPAASTQLIRQQFFVWHIRERKEPQS